MDYQKQTSDWIAENPETYNLIKSFCSQLVAAKRKFGMRLVIERVRWEVKLNYDKDFVFKLNNNHIAYLSRQLILEIPNMQDYVEIRRAKDDKRLKTLESKSPVSQSKRVFTQILL